MKKEVLDVNGKYRLVKQSNKFLIEEQSGFLHFWKLNKCFSYNCENRYPITKAAAYKYYYKVIGR